MSDVDATADAPKSTEPPNEPSVDELTAEFRESVAQVDAAAAQQAVEPAIEPVDLPSWERNLQDLRAQHEETREFIQSYLEEERAAKDRHDVAEAVERFRYDQDIPNEISDAVIASMLKTARDAKPEWREAWDQREGDTKAWSAVQWRIFDAAMQQLAPTVAIIRDFHQRDDIRRAVASLRNVSLTPQRPNEPDARALARMSNDEFDTYKAARIAEAEADRGGIRMPRSGV